MDRKRWHIGRKGQLALAAAALVAGVAMVLVVVWPKPAPPVPPVVPPAVVQRPISKTPGTDTLAPLPIAPKPGTPAPAPAAAAPTSFTPPAPGLPAWQRNAVTVIPPIGGPPNSRPMIAIVIDDVGLDRRRSAEAMALPGPLTFSFMTYAEELGHQTALARSHGHEVMLHVPMEPLAAKVDPGPNALRVGLDDAEIRRRLEWDLGRIDGIVGINNHMGSRFTEWTAGMTVVLSVLRDRGLFFLDSRTTPHSVGIVLARQLGVPHAARDVFLDDTMTPTAVAEQLARTEAVARRHGQVIAIGHPHDATIAALRAWLPTLEQKGFRLVPVSTIVQHNEELAGRVPKPAG